MRCDFDIFESYDRSRKAEAPRMSSRDVLCYDAPHGATRPQSDNPGDFPGKKEGREKERMELSWVR